MDLQPAFIPAREALATAYRSSGRHVDATEQLEALAALDRGRPARLIALGLEYADARRTDLAVATLGRAAERFPDNVDVYATLGEVWLRIAVDTGDRVALRKALEALRTAVVRGDRAASWRFTVARCWPPATRPPRCGRCGKLRPNCR